MARIFTDRQTNRMLAKLANDDVRAAAERVAAAASANAAGHSDTGEYASSFHVRAANALDYEVVSSDPAGLSKEFGHHAKNGKFVEGIHALERAIEGV